MNFMLSKQLEKLRLAKGETRKQVAANLNIDQSTYGKYELGHREPSFEF